MIWRTLRPGVPWHARALTEVRVRRMKGVTLLEPASNAYLIDAGVHPCLRHGAFGVDALAPMRKRLFPPRPRRGPINPRGI